MTCKKCGKAIIVDRMFGENTHYELECLGCGQRWFLSKTESELGRWLAQKDRESTITR